jgi:hypothetical protein
LVGFAIEKKLCLPFVFCCDLWYFFLLLYEHVHSKRYQLDLLLVFFFVVVGDSSSWCSWLRGVLLPSGSEWVIIYCLIMEFVTVSFEELLCYLFVKCSGPQDFPYAYCFFYVTFVPLRWIYYRFKKSHYYLLVCCSLVYFLLLLTGSRSFY